MFDLLSNKTFTFELSGEEYDWLITPMDKRDSDSMDEGYEKIDDVLSYWQLVLKSVPHHAVKRAHLEFIEIWIHHYESDDFQECEAILKLYNEEFLGLSVKGNVVIGTIGDIVEATDIFDCMKEQKSDIKSLN